jgi:antitoxin VapB
MRKQSGSTAAEAISIESKEVEIFRRGDEIVLREKNGTMVRAFDLLVSVPEDLQKRKGL